MEPKSVFKRKIARINLTIREALLDLKSIKSPGLKGKTILYDTTNHMMEGGKRIRPLICMLACEGVEGNSSKVLPTAVGIELIHTFTLIHDDIMDGDDKRRGKPSIHSMCGEPLAILTGDSLFALGFKWISSNFEMDGIDEGRMRRVLNLATDTCLKLAQGQLMDLSSASDPGVDWRESATDLKTAPLFGLASAAGAILGGGTEEEIECMEKYGSYLGMAFQIKDDVLNLTGNAERIGKPNGGDLTNGKLTLPIAHALRGAQEKKNLSILKREPKKIAELIKQNGSIGYAERVARKIVREAKQNLEVLKEESARNALAMLADYAVARGV